MKYKVGDKVKQIGDKPFKTVIGIIGTVVNVIESAKVDYPYDVDFSEIGTGFLYSENEIEPIGDQS